ncbi:MAG: hypothetical protein M1822_009254 [Bathelium mastoideum]|nr:MAG: hypothetical protein M1822_009254 [Bathelium mastoideum]
MQAALNKLGYPCYNGFTLISNPRDAEMWVEALDAKFFNKGTPFTRRDWDQLLGDASSVGDVPVIAFSDDLIDAYPDAKVILVKRDVEKWYRSFDDAIIKNCFSPVVRALTRLDPYLMSRLGAVGIRWMEGWFAGGVHSREEMREKARLFYHQHYEMVEKKVAPERLLKLRLADGWGPLCEFLGEPVPKESFPRVNESDALQELMAMIIRRALLNTIFSRSRYFVPIALLSFAVYLRMR